MYRFFFVLTNLQYLLVLLLQCQVINSGGSGTVSAGLPQGETDGFYKLSLNSFIFCIIDYIFDNTKKKSRFDFLSEMIFSSQVNIV